MNHNELLRIMEAIYQPVREGKSIELKSADSRVLSGARRIRKRLEKFT